MKYIETYDSYIKYANKCKELIRKTIFTKIDLDELKTKDNDDINELITNHRIKMINIKIDHTMRMIEQIINVNHSMNFRFNFAEVMKVAILYHDIGRLRQATWSNTFNDGVYKKLNKPFNNHGEDGYDIFVNNDFNVDSKYVPVISKSILHHLDHKQISRLNYKFNSDLSVYDIDRVVTGSYNLNEGEWQAASLIVQLVADIDKADILYQHLSLDFEMIKDYVYDRSMHSLDEISVFWDIPKKEILEFNNIDENSYVPYVIKIPTKNMDVSKLEVPLYFKEMFYNNTWPPLPKLIKDFNWNFITALWWRLSVFLNGITFYSTLEAISTSEIIKKIYEKIPDIYKPLVSEAFIYANEVLINQKLEDSKGKIYL